MNAAINFAIYCVTGRKFRDVFREVLCCVGIRSRPSGTHNTNSSSSNSSNRSGRGGRRNKHVTSSNNSRNSLNSSGHNELGNRFHRWLCGSRGASRRFGGVLRLRSSTTCSTITSHDVTHDGAETMIALKTPH
ncbi:hypothetical protein ElyMa_001547800 [Elysia marginata]|uniref:G-protein coupled receptors family 1 profile domain-containing protein n=1 Tax=Elysia marginata TaxID=1093978 RepID=A0AAV4JCY7_9GAST|nr:hypothetical protein ElyMa_001547800 [Elysia marginata]